MPLYRFEFVGGNKAPDVVAEFADNEAAKHEAMRTMAEVDLDAITYRGERIAAIKIFDEHQRLIGVVKALTFIDPSGEGS